MAEEILRTVDIDSEEKEEGLSFMDILSLCLSKWYWIVASVVICLIIAMLYIKTTPPTYKRTAAVLIKEENRRRSSGQIADLSELSSLGLTSSVYNEILTLKSPSVISGVVKNLGMDVDYYVDGFFYDKLLYGSDLPFKISFLDMDNQSLRGKLKVEEDKFKLEVDNFNGESCQYTVEGALLDSIQTPFGGTVIVSRSAEYIPKEDAEPISEVDIVKKRFNIAVEICIANMEADLADKNAEVIDLSYTDVSIERATDVVNTIIDVYNENWLKEKNQIIVSTSEFINERLGVIEKELGSVDSDISSYKSANKIPSVEQTATIYTGKKIDINDQLFDYNNRKSMATYIRQQLNSNMTKNQLLPANSGIENASIEKQIADYNSNLLQRNNLAANSNEQNPMLVEMDQQLNQMRQVIKASLENYIYVLNGQIQTLERKDALSSSQLTTNPTQAKYILSVERQQKVKESSCRSVRRMKSAKASQPITLESSTGLWVQTSL